MMGPGGPGFGPGGPGMMGPGGPGFGPPPEGPVFVFDEQGLPPLPAGTSTVNVAGSGQTIVGATGNEIFSFTNSAGSGASSNVISGFNVANDTLNFTKAFLKTISGNSGDTLIDAFTAGSITSSQLLSGAGKTAAEQTSELFIYNSTNGKLFFDANGSATTGDNPTGATLVATLDGAPAITFADIAITV